MLYTFNTICSTSVIINGRCTCTCTYGHKFFFCTCKKILNDIYDSSKVTYLEPDMLLCILKC